MSKVPPDDILRTALAVVRDNHGNPMVIDVADAIYAERVRCAAVANVRGSISEAERHEIVASIESGEQP